MKFTSRTPELCISTKWDGESTEGSGVADK